MSLRRKPLRLRDIVSANRRAPAISHVSLWREVEACSDVYYIVKQRESQPEALREQQPIANAGTIVHFPGRQ